MSDRATRAVPEREVLRLGVADGVARPGRPRTGSPSPLGPHPWSIRRTCQTCSSVTIVRSGRDWATATPEGLQGPRCRRYGVEGDGQMSTLVAHRRTSRFPRLRGFACACIGARLQRQRSGVLPTGRVAWPLDPLVAFTRVLGRALMADPQDSIEGPSPGQRSARQICTSTCVDHLKSCQAFDAEVGAIVRNHRVPTTE